MYESPIEIVTRQIVNDVDRKIGEEVYRSMLKVGVRVDREELIKALQYDRGQYVKGYNDGVEALAERLKDYNDINLPDDENAMYNEIIDNTLEEMVGGDSE